MPERFARGTLALVVAASIVLMPGIHAGAQSPAADDGASRVNLTVEQRHVVKELVKELKVPPATGDMSLTIGDTVPERVVAQPIPVEIGQRIPQIRRHAFFLKDQNIVLVNPKDRTIADVIN